MEATTKDLRLHTRELLAATHRGEEIVITLRGKPTARLVPLTTQTESEPKKRNPGFGMWSDDLKTVDDQVRALRKGRQFDEC
ncbi:prevent-host-death family protein [Tamilnaduibacter salinus]|uniref:Prevent-host-death family protein n=2 Tax=Tamilnaduibacter salinus TaxID=1484056 RepID=A0A2A2I5H2_9GAMM|nr:type II toxin-antitoxin system prevent-host-death family antitoxin [Tamilnaduibacter salinus]PAV26648.1 prevent-host-death family protein [Tamilnaduibacter salinus]PVY75487.1 prevent-host-death family protein [Tamilnaduibacter salinus]